MNSRGNIFEYWVAFWKDLQGSQCRKNFPIAKIGEEQAFKEACDYRAKMICILNENGANYSERHGSNV